MPARLQGFVTSLPASCRLHAATRMSAWLHDFWCGIISIRQQHTAACVLGIMPAVRCVSQLPAWPHGQDLPYLSSRLLLLQSSAWLHADLCVHFCMAKRRTACIRVYHC
jgi:hypothetical protein